MADVHVPSLLDDEEISVSNLFDDEIEEACAELREENAAQAARIEELEAERDSWKDDDLNGRVAYDTLREERDTLQKRIKALEAENDTLVHDMAGIYGRTRPVEEFNILKARCEALEWLREIALGRRATLDVIMRRTGDTKVAAIGGFLDIEDAALRAVEG